MGVATTWDSTGVKICIAAFVAGISEMRESCAEMAELSIGGRLIDPNMVMASRKRKVAATVREDLFVRAGVIDCIGGVADLIVFAILGRPTCSVGLPYVWTKRTSFHTPRGTLMRHVDTNVMELTSIRSAPAVNAVPMLSTVLAVIYVAA
jgi:hypothetical protein